MAESKSTPAPATGKPALVDRLGRPMKHGMCRSPENDVWRSMKDRCYNPKSQRYDRYGARGIKVCDRWRDSFETFYEDMGPRPSAGHSIERIDNDGNYEPGNCRWATREEQNRNRSDNVILEYDGLKMTVAEWARKLGACQRTIFYRLAAGWSVEETLSRPVEQRVWNGKRTRTDKVGWKRKRPRLPLGSTHRDVLIAMSKRDWVFPRDIASSVGFSCFRTMNNLADRGLVETKPISHASTRYFRAYRITEAGHAEIQVAKAADGDRRPGGEGGPRP